MNDTNPKIVEMVKEMMGKRSPEERLVMGCSMYGMSKRLLISSILDQNPNASSEFMRGEIFLRFYGCDFNSETKEKIVRYFKHKPKNDNRTERHK